MQTRIVARLALINFPRITLSRDPPGVFKGNRKEAPVKNRQSGKSCVFERGDVPDHSRERLSVKQICYSAVVETRQPLSFNRAVRSFRCASPMAYALRSGGAARRRKAPDANHGKLQTLR